MAPLAAKSAAMVQICSTAYIFIFGRLPLSPALAAQVKLYHNYAHAHTNVGRLRRARATPSLMTFDPSLFLRVGQRSYVRGRRES